jgi:23S rRNA (guanosine2251-2'-O)-methyltransferase
VVLALDGVTDPANLGAIIRSASFFAITAVVLPHDKSASITPVVEKTAAGGLAHVSVCQVNSLVRTLTNLQERGFSVLGTIPGPHPEPSSLDIKGPLVVVVGSEGKGIRPSVRRLCDLKTSLRYREQGTRSLNVASFTSIILYELFRP